MKPSDNTEKEEKNDITDPHDAAFKSAFHKKELARTYYDKKEK